MQSSFVKSRMETYGKAWKNFRFLIWYTTLAFNKREKWNSESNNA
jgi:hypothetical protein